MRVCVCACVRACVCVCVFSVCCNAIINEVPSKSECVVTVSHTPVADMSECFWIFLLASHSGADSGSDALLCGFIKR